MVLSGLTPDMWRDEHTDTINKFLIDPSQQLLLVYIDEQNGLTLCSTVPTFAVKEMAYFAREENASLTTETFIRLVQFGTVKGNYVDALLRRMHDLYAPTFFENRSWPDSILAPT